MPKLQNIVIAFTAYLLLFPQPLLCSEKEIDTAFKHRETPTAISPEKIQELSPDTTLEDLRLSFGEPFAGTLPRLIAWPKKRPDLDFLHDSRETVWRNGYWFFVSKSSPYRISKLLLVASHSIKSEKTTPILNQWKDMTIDWPESWQGRKVQDFFESGGVLPLTEPEQTKLREYRKKLLESSETQYNLVYSFQQGNLRLQIIDADLNSDLFIATDINSGKIVYGEIFEYSYSIAPEHEPVRFLPPPSPGSPALLTIHVGGGQGTGLQHTQTKQEFIEYAIDI